MSIVSLLCIWLIGCEADTDLYGELTQFQEDETITEDFDTTPIPDNATGSEEEFVVDENSYFVSSEASGSNDGKSEATAWTWSEAVAKARPGMTIYVKAGKYTSGNFEFNQRGDSSEKLRFIGYKEVPGDIDAFKQTLLSNSVRDRRGTTRLANDEEFDYTKRPTALDMPFFEKAYLRNDMFFTIRGQFIEFHNFIIKGGDFGMFFNADSANNKVINCIIMEQGNLDIGSRDSSHPDRYQGFGIANRSSTNLEVRFCSFLNSEQHALEIKGANSGVYADNVVYSYNEVNGTDYFFLITSESGRPSSDLIVEYNRCHRLTSTTHGGHGFIVKNGAINNTIRNWKVINTNIEASFASSTNNTFEKGELNGSYYTDGDPLAYILTSNSATGNTFKDIIIDNVWGGLVFLDHGEDRSNAYAGRANDYINIIVKNAQYGVIFSESYAHLGPTTDNQFLNCTFYNTQFGIRAHRENSGNAFINCHFSASASLYTNHRGYVLNANTKFENCHFSGNLNRNSPLAFEENNIIDGNPMFSDPNSIIDGSFDVSGLELLPNSPLRGAGKDIGHLNSKASKDFNGKTRSSFNIGAF
ncbi:Hypothetical protein I595_3510 [Croceitalea dokdonensis DOKDO 023]|uniref:Right handed beta helix domain-containing protein n=2 Tax=Croceitalea TaxID=574891 RepID=A0A0P7AY56_9FLAO|nr:Hypothetical protein I595_3510 [Croceitalea dokdonensis DOKDO 023]